MTETLTLTEFLLVRIAEDEAVAREVRVDDYSYDVAADRRFEAYGDHVEIGVARVLAECAAQRRLVEFLRPDPTMPVDSGRFVASGALALLALSYADHPDYQQEWKP